MVKALFEQLVERPAAERRAALAAAGVPEAVAAEVWSLLLQHAAEEAAEPAAGGFLARPPHLTGLDAVLGPASPPDRRGLRLGPWRLQALLGHGGMGEVWEAQRDDGAYEARVAVKLLPVAGDGARLDHFRQERRSLARLNHPHIARLLDAGETPDGQPYFVMEAVDGRPVDEACRGLSLQARLRLFLQLAEAVAHAHRQGLVHRDLKPSNVLVDGEGQLKLLDFGIAQALDRAQADGELQAPRALTPGFASPEQVRGETATAASDVYALGVLLHLMLTGVRPYGLASQGCTTAAALLHAVLHQAPTRPSEAPLDPHTDGGVPRRQLLGDVDAVTLKALAKPVSERYGSVEALAADVRALLAREPVAARAHTPGYLAGRFFVRHRALVLASLLALLAVGGVLGVSAWRTRDALAVLALAALAAGLGVSSWQARRAAAARDEARGRLAQTGELVRDVLMRYADMATFLPRGQTLRGELLADAIAHLERLHVSAPGDAALTAELAKAHARLADLMLPVRDTSLNRPEEARVHAERALALFPVGERAAAADADADFFVWWGRSLGVQAKLAQLAGDPRQAHEICLRGRRMVQAALRRNPGHLLLRGELASLMLAAAQTADTWFETSLGSAEQALALLAEAREQLQALAEAQPREGAPRYQLGTVAGAVQIVRFKQGRLAEAVAAGREAVAWREQALALEPEHTSFREGLAGEASNAASVLLAAAAAGLPERAQLPAEAEALTARADALMRALEADDPGLPAWTSRRRWFAMHRGRALHAVGRSAEALAHLDDAMAEMAAAASGPVIGRRGWCGLDRARVLLALGRRAEALAQLHAARADLQQHLRDQPQDTEAQQRDAEAAAQATALAAAGVVPQPGPGGPAAA